MSRFWIVAGSLTGALLVFLLGRTVEYHVAGLVCAGLGVLCLVVGQFVERRRRR